MLTVRRLVGFKKIQIWRDELYSGASRPTRSQIALDIGISGTSMAFHRRNIFRKAGVSRQQDLVAVIFRGSALRAGLGHS